MYPSLKLTPVSQKRIRREKIMTPLKPLDSDKDPIRVYCRLRPSNNDSFTNYMNISSREIMVKWNIKGVQKELIHTFQEVFDAHSTQEEVYTKVGHPLVQDLIEGKNGLLFTYGVTASGKTFTLQGNQENPGILPRCINVIFNSLETYQTPKFVVRPDKINGFEIQLETNAMQNRLTALATPQILKLEEEKCYKKLPFNNNGVKVPIKNKSHLYAVFISYVEIYNNTVYDLLEGQNDFKRGKILSQDIYRNTYVNGAIEVEVKTSEEAYALLTYGQNRRKKAHTLLNTKSSRSHSVFNIRVVQLKKDIKNVLSDQGIVISQLSLVDLAGSERTNRTQNSGARLKESSAINNSLMTLRSCLDTLRENQKLGTNKVIPYRDSRLTLLFKNYFEGNGSVHMIICINPTVPNLNENLQVMKFAQFSQNVKVSRSTPTYTPVTIKCTAPATTNAKSPLVLHCPSFQFCEPGFDLYLENKLTTMKMININTLNTLAKIQKEQQNFKKRLINKLSNNPSTIHKPTNQNQLKKTGELDLKMASLNNPSGAMNGKQITGKLNENQEQQNFKKRLINKLNNNPSTIHKSTNQNQLKKTGELDLKMASLNNPSGAMNGKQITGKLHENQVTIKEPQKKFENMLIEGKSSESFLEVKLKKEHAELYMDNGIDKETLDKNTISSPTSTPQLQTKTKDLNLLKDNN